MDWLAGLTALESEARPGVLVTVAAVRGHTPREAGAKMVVAAAGAPTGIATTWGSIGGGNLEADAVDLAQGMMEAAAIEPVLHTARLNDRAETRHGQQCCGGEVTLLLEPLRVAPTVAIFGMGHVGLELARILSRLDVRLHLIDSRAAQLAPERLAGGLEGPATVLRHETPVPESVLAQLPGGSHVLVMTHDHAEDAAFCDMALRRPDLGSIGLIGSSAKWRRFRQTLSGLGHDEEALARITTPIGVPGLAGKQPAVIAISVAAVLLSRLSGA